VIKCVCCDVPRDLTHCLQSAEEIAKYATEEGLSEYERLVVLLRRGKPVQRLAVYGCVGQVFDEADIGGSLSSIATIISVRGVLDLWVSSATDWRCFGAVSFDPACDTR